MNTYFASDIVAAYYCKFYDKSGRENDWSVTFTGSLESAITRVQECVNTLPNLEGGIVADDMTGEILHEYKKEG